MLLEYSFHAGLDPLSFRLVGTTQRTEMVKCPGQIQPQAEPRETATENRPRRTQQGKARKRGALRPEESFWSNLSL